MTRDERIANERGEREPNWQDPELREAMAVLLELLLEANEAPSEKGGES